MKPPSLTIGIEEEYQIVDPETRELRSYITQILEEGKLTLREQVKPELHQAMVEVGSNVCQTPGELREELVRLRRRHRRSPLGARQSTVFHGPTILLPTFSRAAHADTG